MCVCVHVLFSMWPNLVHDIQPASNCKLINPCRSLEKYVTAFVIPFSAAYFLICLRGVVRAGVTARLRGQVSS